jgi:hypothetical protein
MSRIVSFFDGAQSETTPTIGNIVASSLVQYADDATYEANEQGAPAEGNIYFNTTSNLIRYYNGTAWISLVDETSTQTLENKEIDGSSTGNNIVLTVADNVEVTPAGNLTSTNTQDALEELQGDIDGLDSRLDTAEADIIDLQTDKENKSEKGQPNGYAPLDGSGLVPPANLPSYVDDVLEYANIAAFPVTGETGKIYVAIDTSKIYRWTGSIYVEISSVGTFNLDDLTDVTITGVATGQKLQYNGSAWVNATDDLNSLSDTIITVPATGEKLRYNGTNWVNTTDNLDSLSDVVITAPATTEVLTYNGTNWVNSPPSSGSLDSLTDVVVTAPATGDLLRYNGTNWVNTDELEPVYFFAHRNSVNQTGISTNNTSQKIVHNVTASDSHSGFNTTTGVYTVPAGKGGRWIITASFQCLNTNILAGRQQSYVLINGSPIILGHNPVLSAGTSECLSVTSAPFLLNDGDTIEHHIFSAANNSVSTLTVNGSLSVTFFGAHRIGS